MAKRWAVACVVLWTQLASAHWTAQPELPDWAQRGTLTWCLHYSRTDRSLVDLFADGGQTFIHGGSWDTPETAAYARSKGLRYMPYVCSRTYTTAEMARVPQLRGAMVLRPDRSEYLAYGNPARRYGSLAVPDWLEYVKQRTRDVMRLPETAAVFYDNVWLDEDHRPEAIADWQTWAKAHDVPPGDDMPAFRSGPQSAAVRTFLNERLIRHYTALRRFCREHDPPLLISPNLGSLPGFGMAIVEAGATDLVFYETDSHPPFEHNDLRYKIGLASSHGRPTGILAYLPTKVAAERGEKTWHEGMHSYFWPSSPLPEEIALAACEAAACGGSYIPCYNLFPSLPITDLSDPFCQRIHWAIRQSYRFIHATDELYRQAQPGSPVALFYSSATTWQDHRRQNLTELAARLTAAGLPYEVVGSPDAVAPDGLRGVRTLILPNVSVIDEPTAAGLLRFVEQGGRAIIGGEFAAVDPLGRPSPAASAKRLLAALRLVSRPVQSWTLDGCEPEGPATIRVKEKVGRAVWVSDQPPGRYRAHLQLTDESDGTSSFTVRVGAREVFSGQLDSEDDQRHWFSTPPFDLATGDPVTVTIHADAGERGRLHAVVLCSAEAEDGAQLGQGQVGYLPGGVESLPADKLRALLRPEVQLPEPGQVTVNVRREPELGLQSIHLVNYDFRYEVERPGVYATDQGNWGARVFFAGQPVAIRKVLRLPDPSRVNEPVLMLMASATAGCQADLVVTINDQPAGRLSAQGGQRQGWHELPLTRALLAPEMRIDIRAEGPLDLNHWWQIGIDTSVKGGGSWFSTDGGRTFSADDLSPDLKAQRGEYLIRVRDKAPEGSPTEPGNLVANPGFEHVRVPHSETRLTVVPAKHVAVRVAGPPRECLAMAPDRPPEWLTGRADGAETIYSVPQVEIASTLVLAERRAPLERLRQAQLAAAPWALPPVTAPLRPKVMGWEPYGRGFAIEPATVHSGRRALAASATGEDELAGAVQQLELQQRAARPLQITAWSRAVGVGGQPDAHYAIYVDATYADGSVYNGRFAPFAVGTHDWQQATLQLDPRQPIRSLRLYLLFRRHTGRVWFDDVAAKELPAN